MLRWPGSVLAACWPRPAFTGMSKDSSGILTDAGRAGLEDFHEELIVRWADCSRRALLAVSRPHLNSGDAAIGSAGDQAEAWRYLILPARVTVAGVPAEPDGSVWPCPPRSLRLPTRPPSPGPTACPRPRPAPTARRRDRSGPASLPRPLRTPCASRDCASPPRSASRPSAARALAPSNPLG